MMKLPPSDKDDPAFLALANHILNGAVATLEISEVFLVQVDNWFDHKWLGWRSRGDDPELRVPLFTPNRVRSEKHFVRDASDSAWQAAPMPKPLHLHQPGRPWLAEPLDRFSKRAAFIWYSGNSATNGRGSIMFYASGADGYSWYASLAGGEQWTIADECRVTKRELLSFEQRGRQLEASYRQ